MIKVALGGRISESIFFTKITSGASDDIKKVTQISRGLVDTYGMSEKMGLVSYASLGNEYVNAYSNNTQ